MIDAARQISSRLGVFWTDQLNNHDATRGYHELGEELWTQTGANVVAPLRVAERLGPAAIVATIVVDSGVRYLTTDVFRSA